MKLIDIHCHILPGVDDGPEEMEETCEMLDAMNRDHICAAIATPHFRPGLFDASEEQIRRAYLAARKKAMERNVKLFLGAEFYRQSEMEEFVGRRIRGNMAGGKFVLVEFSGMDLFGTIRNQLYSLIVRGYEPIIAHIERYECCRNMEKVRELKSMGVWIQVNSDTVLGKTGWKNKQFAKKLLKEEMIDFIASDAHGMKKRTNSLAECAEYVKRKFGAEKAKEIFYKNPMRIIHSGRVQ